MKDLYIIGAGGLGREVAWVVERINKDRETWNLKGFIDDNKEIHGNVLNGYPVVGGVETLAGFKDAYAVCAIGSAEIKSRIIERVIKTAPDVKFATLIDPSVEMSDTVEIGEGTVICPHNILTVNIKVGKHVYINLDCTVGHDAVIEDFVSVMPSANISGISHIGARTEIGTGAQIIQGINIAPDVMLGAGAVVIKDINEAGTYMGVPAKMKKGNK